MDVDLHNDIKSMANDWEEQTKASGVINPRARRWHPLFIKWCLYLRHLSGKAYELVRDSECVQLPSQRTLPLGFQVRLMRCFWTFKVFDNHFKTMLGFVYLGDFNTHLSQYEASLLGESGQPVLAKSMLVLMVRGLFIFQMHNLLARI